MKKVSLVISTSNYRHKYSVGKSVTIKRISGSENSLNDEYSKCELIYMHRWLVIKYFMVNVDLDQGYFFIIDFDILNWVFFFFKKK